MPHTDDEAGPVPCAEALIAATVALMTSWAAPCPPGAPGMTPQRALLARRIAANLFLLQQHPRLCPPLQRVMEKAHRRWISIDSLAQENGDGPPAPAPLTSLPTMH